jgi:dTDP-4-dehydrorhamnose 3,5-epimerase
MHKTELSLSGVFEITPAVFFDERGYFYESFKAPFFLEIGAEFVQDNHSFSKKGVLRGMHFQKGQAKLINVISGCIFDVFVDIRKDSKTFGKWEGVVLDSKQRKMLLIPDGFAHGFYVLSDEAHVVYKVSSLYRKEEERSFFYGDKDIGIVWPEGERIVSQRDLSAPSFREVCE